MWPPPAQHTKDGLVFDEVDAGIGGDTALEVGQQLQKLGVLRQVLCVTHLPQVAAYATHHLHVRKKVHNTLANTNIIPVKHTERIEELARMLSGNTHPSKIFSSRAITARDRPVIPQFLKYLP